MIILPQNFDRTVSPWVEVYPQSFLSISMSLSLYHPQCPLALPDSLFEA